MFRFLAIQLGAALLFFFVYNTIEVKAGHDRGEVPTYIVVACDNPASPVGVIEATVQGRSEAFLQSQIRQGRCKRFDRAPLNFWFDRVVIDDLVWSDGTLMYVVQGHDSSGYSTIFTWVPAETAHKRGWLPSPSPQ